MISVFSLFVGISLMILIKNIFLKDSFSDEEMTLFMILSFFSSIIYEYDIKKVENIKEFIFKEVIETFMFAILLLLFVMLITYTKTFESRFYDLYFLSLLFMIGLKSMKVSRMV